MEYFETEDKTKVMAMVGENLFKENSINDLIDNIAFEIMGKNKGGYVHG